MSFAVSFGACLAELTGEQPPASGEADAVARAREWLATRGLGLVPVRDPATFGWPAPWIARLRGGRAVLAFGTPPGVIGDPGGSGAEAADFVEGWVLAPAGPAVATTPATADGVVELVLLAPGATAPVQRVESAVASAGRGLEGDRYAAGTGTFSPGAGTGRDLTLVAAEALEELGVAPEAARRNVVTRGIDLDALIGRPFRIGPVECLGQRRCEPCAHLERLGPPGILRRLVHRGGLRADVLAGGTVAVGARVTASAQR